MATRRSSGRALLDQNDRERLSTARISIASVAVTVAILAWALARAYLAG